MITGVSIDMILANGYPFRAAYESYGAEKSDSIIRATRELAREQGARIVGIYVSEKD